MGYSADCQEELLELCRLSLRALHEDDFPELRQRLREALEKAGDT